MMFLTLFFALFAPRQALAITKASTPTSAVPQEVLSTPTPAQESNNTLEDIQKIRQAVQQKVQEKLQAITQTKTTQKAWIGTITDLNVNTITISFQGSTKVLNFSSDTAFVNDKRKKITSDDLKTGQSILAMGDITADNSLDAKRIVITDLSVLKKKQIVIGKIADISKSSPIFVLIPTNNKNIQYQIKTDTNTQVTNRTGAKIDLKTFVAGQKIIAILTQDPKNPKSYTAFKLIAVDITTPASPTPTPKK